MVQKDQVPSGELTKKLKAVKAKDFMTPAVSTVTESMTLADLAERMIRARISGFPVVEENGEMKGIITATDLFNMMDMIRICDSAEGGTPAVRNPLVKHAMSTHVFSIGPEATLDEIITIIKEKNIHTLPVFEQGKLVGVIGRRDVFKNFYALVNECFAGQ